MLFSQKISRPKGPPKQQKSVATIMLLITRALIMSSTN
jgi:hypothetical protein